MALQFYNTRCIEGRTFRHDPQHDDPYLETDIGQCQECGGQGCLEVFIAEAEAKIRKKIKTHFEYPPIPDRRFDWCATTDNYDGEGSPIGWGRTEQDAIDDLLEQMIDAGADITKANSQFGVGA